MRKSLIISICLSALSIYLQFRTIKPDIFLEEIYTHLPLFLLICFTIWALIRDTNRFKSSAKYSSFLPSAIGTSALVIVIMSMYYRSDEGYGKTAFKAYNHRINHGVVLDFKENNNLKITQRYKMGETTYWGTYKRDRDTISLTIDLDFKLGSKAVLKNDTLAFLTTGHLFAVQWRLKKESNVIVTPLD